LGVDVVFGTSILPAMAAPNSIFIRQMKIIPLSLSILQEPLWFY